MFTDGAENVALQHGPSELLTCAMTLGFPCNGSGPNDGLLAAFICTFASSGVFAALSVTPTMPFGMPVELLNFQTLRFAVQTPPPLTDGEPLRTRAYPPGAV